MRAAVALLLSVGCATASDPAANAPTANFETTYAPEVPVEAQLAFAHAARRWAEVIRSDVPIRIRVGWIPGPKGPTAFALPRPVRDFPGARLARTDYAAALADARVGRDLHPGEPDAQIFFKGSERWYYGLDAQPGPEEQDFVSTAMHEIGHALGISSSAFVPWDSDVASLGRPNEYLSYFEWPFPLELDGTPSAFDRLVHDAKGRPITDAAVFPNPSRALFTALKGPIFFQGILARSVNKGAPVRLDSGSVCHLAEAELSPESADRLMIPDLGKGKAMHRVGPRIRSLLKDLGWSIR